MPSSTRKPSERAGSTTSAVLLIVLFLTGVILWAEEGRLKLHPGRAGNQAAEARAERLPVTGNASSQAQGEPLALASGDFDEDGINDLVSSYASLQGGHIRLHRGNIAAIYPNASATKQTTASRDSAFLAPSFSSDLTFAPDCLSAGDFDADGHQDLIAAMRQGSSLSLLKGDGRGSFLFAGSLELPGRVTALRAGELNRADGLADIFVGVSDENKAQLLVYESPEGAWRARPESFALPGAATEIVTGLLDRDEFYDVALAADRDLIIVAGRDRRLSLDQSQQSLAAQAAISRQSFAASISSLAAGRFTDALSNQLAMLTDEGAIQVISPGSNRNLKTQSGNNGWRIEAIAAQIHATSIISAQVTGGRFDDLILLDAESQGLQVIAAPDQVSAASTERQIARSLEVSGAPVAALPLRLNREARDGLALLIKGQTALVEIPAAPAATFTVNSTSDAADLQPGDGVCAAPAGQAGGQVCTLRAAIQEANALTGADTIVFSIGTGQQSITVGTPLPAITQPLTIDGRTQPGFVGAPLILLRSPSGDISVGAGLTIATNNSTVRGLIINGFRGPGIQITGSSNIIEGNFVGADPTGAQAVPNLGDGVLINGIGASTANNNLIGGTSGAARNVISGNSFNGVRIDGSAQSIGVIARSAQNPSEAKTATGNLVQGNFIGLNAAGSASLGNTFSGVLITSASNNTIGGTTAGARNVISANAIGGLASITDGGHQTRAVLQSGIAGIRIAGSVVSGPANGNLIQGNFIGTDLNGRVGLGNFGDGVEISGGANNTIGGTVIDARNVISDNEGSGIGLVSNGAAGASGNLIQGNFIGVSNATASAPSLALGNLGDGVTIGAFFGFGQVANNIVGGATSAALNEIAFNGSEGGSGVAIPTPTGSPQVRGNSVTGNSIHDNSSLGIDLGAAGVTANDAGDGDTGPNDLQNFPTLLSAVTNGANTTVRGQLNSLPNATFRIELFGNTACDSSQNGEGERFLTLVSATTDANGNATFTAIVTPALALGQFVTATATDASGSTSEFSTCVLVVGCPTFPNNYIPFAQVYSITGPNASGDRLIVGRMTQANFAILQSLALPAFVNEQYCVEVELSPGLLATAYVPSATERSGNFSSFGVPIIDPIINLPFPNNIIPANRLPDPFAWRVSNFRRAAADLAVTKTATPNPVTLGQNLTFNVTVTNRGPGTATGIRLTDSATGSFTIVSVNAPPPGICTPSTNGVNCTLPDLLSGASVTATVVVRPTAGGTITNTASVTSDNPDPDQPSNTATVTVQVNATADLALSKTITAPVSTVLPAPGDDVTYQLVVTNSGPLAAANVTLTDVVPTNMTFRSVSAPTGWSCTSPVVGSTGTITCATNSLATGATANFTVVLTVGGSVVRGTTLTNTAQLSAQTPDPVAANNSSSASVVTGLPGSVISPGSRLEIGPVLAVREPGNNPASNNFTLQNTGDAPLTYTLTSLLRTGADVDSGRITTADDRGIFQLRLTSSQGEISAPYGQPLTLPAGVQQSFRVNFIPLIPILAGKFNGIASNQALPETVTSRLTITPRTGAPILIDLIGIVRPMARLIHPLDPRLAPLVTLNPSGSDLTVECSIYDPNLNLSVVRYEFQDSSGKLVSDPVDVDPRDAIAEAISRGLARGQGFRLAQRFQGAADTGIARVRVSVFDEGSDTAFSGAAGTPQAAIASVSAASYTEFGLSNESIVAGFGDALAAGIHTASDNPLPVTLGGTRVSIRDGAGVEWNAPLFFVSPRQINYQLPPRLAPGAATVTVSNQSGTLAIGALRVAETFPGLFAANSDGQGVAAALMLRVKANTTQSYEAVARYDQTLKRYVSTPLDPGAESDRLFLVLFGTGIRHRSSLAAVQVTLSGTEAPVLYAGAQGAFTGLDQINIELPRHLFGRGETEIALRVGGQSANRVSVNLGGQKEFGIRNSEYGSQNAEARIFSHASDSHLLISLPPIRWKADVTNRIGKKERQP
jgi:uncharacterized protein (TIGR03437 family)